MDAMGIVRDVRGRMVRLLVTGAVAAALAAGLGIGLGPDPAAAQTFEEVEVIDCAPVVTADFTGCIEGVYIRSNGR